MIINASKIAAVFRNKMKRFLQSNNVIPTLVIIMVGDNQASKLYITQKIKMCKRVGIRAELCNLDIDISESGLLEALDGYNKDDSVHGIIVQLPLPIRIDKHIIFQNIAVNKDVDGLNPYNIGLHDIGIKSGFVPCTALGCLQLLKGVHSDLTGKSVVIVGRSLIVGKPLARLLLQNNCTVTIAHSYTKNLKSLTIQADIVVLAVGSVERFNSEYFNKSATVIDVGSTIVESDRGKRVVGDVNFAEVEHEVRYLTKVPGGVGQMTVAYLLLNTIFSYYKKNNTKLTFEDLINEIESI